MTNATSRIVLLAAWDSARTRGWRRELVDTGDWHALRPAHSIADVQALLVQHTADLVITDLKLHDGLATDLIRVLRNTPQTRATRILVVSRMADPLLLDALQEGADGVLDQSAAGSAPMAEQARNLMAGGVDIAPWIARQLLDFFESQLTGVVVPTARTRVESITNPLELTPTERQLLRHLSVGERLAEAAQRVGLEPADCTARVRSIHRRMQWSIRAGDLSLS